MNRHRTGLVAAVAALVLLVSCAQDTKKPVSSPQGPARVERLRLAGGDWGFPSPFGGNTRGPSVAHSSFIFDSLLWKDADGTYIPWLATAWQQSPDGKEWRFTLRDGVRFTDGQPLTIDDVVFSFQYVTTGAAKTVAMFAGRIPVKEALADGPNTLVLRTETPFAPFLDRVAVRVPIIPKRVWEKVADPAKYREADGLIGTGPYRLASQDEAAGSYLYLANDDHFMGPPYVKRLEFVKAPDELQALQRGELDVATIGAGQSNDAAVPDELLNALKASDKFGIVEASGTVGRVLHFNISKGFPFDDKRFRQAVAYTMDRPDLVRRILLGQGEPAMMGLLQPSDSPWAAQDLPTYPRDLNKAKALLDQAGLRDVNGDGMRELPDGQTFKPEMLSATTWSEKTGELVKEYLRQVGIDISIRVLDQTSADKTTTEGRYELALIGYGINSDPDGLRTQIGSKSPATSFARVHGYVNPRFDELATAQLSEMDVAKRTAIAQELQRIAAEDVVAVPLYVAERFTVFDKTLSDNFYYTKGGGPLYPGILNKLIFTSSKRSGF